MKKMVNEVKKMKKKKRKHEDSDAAVEDGIKRKKKKEIVENGEKKKKKSSEDQILDANLKKCKNDDKTIKEDVLGDGILDVTSEAANQVYKKEKKKRKKKKLKEMNNSQLVEENSGAVITADDESVSVGEKPVKSKKKSKKKEKGDILNANVVEKEENVMDNQTMSNCENKVKKKKRKNVEHLDVLDKIENGQNETIGSKKKKKKSKEKKSLNGEILTHSEPTDNGKPVLKCEEDQLNQEIQNKPTESTKRKLKKKKKGISKNTNKELDSAGENMEKEKVASHDVNKECGKTKDNSSDGLITSDKQQETKLGQWSTARFNDNNRQEKFLRLMGGKKAVGKKTGLWSGKTTFANAAMDQTESRKLATKLEGQFQNALEFNLQKRNENNRTKGLGFVEDPAKGKKFHIDINKTNSVKFN